MDAYEKSDLNTVKRHPERAKYDKVNLIRNLYSVKLDLNEGLSKETVAAIIHESKILHVAFVDEDGMPQCVPMIGALEEDKQGDHILFLHGWCDLFKKSSRA
jgi:uncharacterized protein